MLWLPVPMTRPSFVEQVKVLALTDHDTMAGVSEAVQAGHKFGIKIIPGVEISAIFSSRYFISIAYRRFSTSL